MPVERKNFIPVYLTPPGPQTVLRIQQPGYPAPFKTQAGDLVGAETTARVAADDVLQANIDAEAAARVAEDTVLQANIDSEASIRASQDASLAAAINGEADVRASVDSALETQITNETTARVNGDTAAFWAGLDLSHLPTADPGSGRPWLSGGNIRVGP